MPNQDCNARPRRRRRPGRILLVLLSGPLLILGGTLGVWMHVHAERQALAPVIRVMDDGTVLINGREIVIGPDGLPPKALAEIEGGPPLEKSKPVQLGASWLGESYIFRSWRYPRLNLLLSISRRVEAGGVEYQGKLHFDALHPATLELRERRWWLGKPGPLGPLRPGHFVTTVPGVRDIAWTLLSDNHWLLAAGDARVTVHFMEHDWLPWPRLEALRTQQFDRASVTLPSVYGGSAEARAAAFKAGGEKDARQGW